MTDHPGTLTMVDRVEAALELVLPAVRTSAPARSAVMYAESIDDDDDGDGFFRFGSRLLTALEALGLASTARALLLPRPVIGRLQPVDHPRHLVAVPSRRVSLAA